MPITFHSLPVMDRTVRPIMGPFPGTDPSYNARLDSASSGGTIPNRVIRKCYVRILLVLPIL